ncbi:MAG: esterase family protein [Thermoflexales bacterium]|nr:esterase family protein [Thermoflexales bacterium]
MNNAVSFERIPNFESSHLGNSRTLTILLPPGYRSPAEAHTRYKTLYLNDGQDLEALRLAETLARLYAAGAIERLIVVAVPTNADRLQEYGIAATPDYKARGSKAAAYTRFLLDEVMPVINAQYRTASGAENTAILGASLGGLSAFDIAWNHPERFGRVGVFSGSFWWRTQSNNVEEMQASRIAHAMVKAAPLTAARRELNFWFEAGTEDETDDRDQNGVIDAIQDTTELIDALQSRGFRPGRDIQYVEVPGGRHDPATWAGVMDVFLRWGFGR